MDSLIMLVDSHHSAINRTSAWVPKPKNERNLRSHAQEEDR